MDKVVVETLRSISKLVKKDIHLEEINSGGCAYFATFVKHYLDMAGIECQYVYIDDEKNDEVSLVEKIIDPSVRSSASHVALKVGGCFYDANGFSKSEQRFINEYGHTRNMFITAFEMHSSTYYQSAIQTKRGSWNSYYGYRNNNPILKKIITDAFERLYKSNKIPSETLLMANEALDNMP